ncbi:MAG: hypothetical protein AB7V13_27965 [Pseudorhodoplanes sp.]
MTEAIYAPLDGWLVMLLDGWLPPNPVEPMPHRHGDWSILLTREVGE